MKNTLVIEEGKIVDFRRASITATAGTPAEVAPARPNMTIRLLSIFYVGSGSTVTFKSGTDNISPTFPDTEPGFVLPFQKEGWFETAENKALNILAASANGVAQVIFCYIPTGRPYQGA